MKKKISVLLLLSILMACNSTHIRKEKINSFDSYSLDANHTNVKVYSGKPIKVSNGFGKNILVILNKQKVFANDWNRILDTLNPVYSYKIISQKDSVKIFTNTETIEKVILIYK